MAQRLQAYFQQEQEDPTITVRFHGEYHRDGVQPADSYRLDGRYRNCETCSGAPNESNGAGILDLGEGVFIYHCFAERGGTVRVFLPHDLPSDLVYAEEHDDGDENGRVPDFSDCLERCFDLLGPMGSGKTHVAELFFRRYTGNPSVPDASILIICCRRSMCSSMAHRLEDLGFELYTSNIKARRLVIEYESLCRLQTTYDVIYMDEIRSVLRTAVCYVTNRMNAVRHLDRLVELCTKAKHTLLTDADSNLDCAVDIFRDSIFEKKDVRTIRVLKPFMQRTFTLMSKDATYKQMYADLRDGKPVVAFFASVKMLRGCMERLAIMDKDLIAGYFADSENKDDLFDVNRFRGKCRFIGYTSTVTVSLDFTEEVFRVYAFPNKFSSGYRQVKECPHKAEQALKLRAWYPHFMWMVKKKGYKVEYADVDHEEPTEGTPDIVREVATAGEVIAAKEIEDMDDIGATELDAEWEDMMNKKKSNDMLAPLERLALRKYQVQKHFTAPLTGDDVLFFEKHRKAVVYRILKEKATPAQLYAKHMEKVEIARECDMEFVVSQDYNIVMALNDLTVKAGYKEGGLEDRTTEVCLKEVDMKSGDVKPAIDKMRELGAGVSKSKTLPGLLTNWLLKPNEIPRVVASATGVVHITGPGMIGGDFSLILPTETLVRRSVLNITVGEDKNLSCGVNDADEKRRLDKVDVNQMDADDNEDLVKKQRAGVATLSDVAKIRKYRVQRFYLDKINASHVLAFNKFRGAISTRAFFRAFPPIVRKRIDINLQLMRETLDEFRPNFTIATGILETLEKMGFKNMGIAGERLDLRNMPSETKLMLEKTITSIRAAKLVRKSRAAESLEEFKCYVKSVWGYKLKSHKKEKGGEKEPMYKISLHFLGRSEIFNEIHTSCEMKALAEHVNTALVADMQPLVAKHDIVLPDGDVLDLGIYTRNRPMSLIGTAKKLGGGAFERTEESKHVPIRSCIVTQQFTRDVSYFELPDGLEVTKKKTKRNIPTRQLVHKPRTREKSETELLLLDYLQTEFGDSVTVTHNGQYGGQDSYAVRGHREFCPCCEDSHDSNGVFLMHLGGLFFRFLLYGVEVDATELLLAPLAMVFNTGAYYLRFFRLLVMYHPELRARWGRYLGESTMVRVLVASFVVVEVIVWSLGLVFRVNSKVAVDVRGLPSWTTTDLSAAGKGDGALDSILHFPPLLEAFEGYCRRALCSESLMFLLHVEALEKTLRHGRTITALSDCEESQHFETFVHVVDKYIRDGSPFEVNIDSRTKREILDAIDSKAFHELTLDDKCRILARAAKEIRKVLTDNLCLKFQVTHEYKDIQEQMLAAQQLMRASLDDFNPSYDISEKIETLEKMGFKDMGVGEERPDLKNMPDDAKKKLDDTITKIRKAKLVRGSRAKDPLEEFKSYLSSILGYKLKYHQLEVLLILKELLVKFDYELMEGQSFQGVLPVNGPKDKLRVILTFKSAA
eukprot:g13926.t1